MRVVSLPGAEPYAHDGSGIGVLVLHGFTGSPKSMRPWAEHLAEHGYTVRVPRLPGHGTTWQELNRTRWEDWYAVAEGAFRELRERCEQVFSAACRWAAPWPPASPRSTARVAGLVLVNPAYRVDDVRLRALPVLQSVVPSLPGIGNDIKKPGQDEGCYDRNPLKALYSQTKLWAIVVRDLPEVTQPVLLMRSAEDHVVPASSSALFLSADLQRGCHRDRPPRRYHVATLDNDAPRIFDETVAFIKRLSALTRDSAP